MFCCPETLITGCKLRVAAIQPSYIPWRGYFDFISNVDCFVFLDDVQYTTRDWRNRNKIKTPNGTKWLSVPVLNNEQAQLIVDSRIDYSTPWRKKHVGTWSANYRRAPYFDVLMDILYGGEIIEDVTISQLNTKLTRILCNYLNISTPMILSSELKLVGSKTDRLIDLLK